MNEHPTGNELPGPNRIAWHWPEFYRYRVASPGLRVTLNSYPGVVIGAAVIVGRFAYCVKWGNARALPAVEDQP